jgi:hypothetical protein
MAGPTSTRNGWLGLRWWPPISPSRTVPGYRRTLIMLAVSLTRSTSPGSPTLLDKAIAGCLDGEVAGIRALGRNLDSWRTEILAHHDTGASNGPTEGL